MTTILTSRAQQRRHTTDSQAARIVELASARLRDPHATQVADLLGVSIEHVQKNEFHRRLAILCSLHKHLLCEQWRGRIGSYLHSPARLVALRTAILEELERFPCVEQSSADSTFAEGYLPAIRASVK
jgi:hypothetical protein